MTIIYPKNYACTATECSVGTGSTSNYPSAIDINDKEIVVIPKYYNDLPVTAVGKYAFKNACGITEVRIDAQIVLIDERSFSDMKNLRKMNIPESVTRIGEYAIQFYGSGTSEGVVNIIFNGKSSLTYIGAEGFGYKAKVVIKFTGTSSPTCASKAFYQTNVVEIYSPVSFMFCNKYKTQILKTPNACATSNKSSRNIARYSLIIVLIYS